MTGQLEINDEQDASPHWACKGFPAPAEGMDAAHLASRTMCLFDDECLFPAAILKKSVLRQNADWMQRFLDLAGLKLAPHGKTTMSPELFEMQLADGAWGMTAATPHHVRVYRHFGINRILLANELVGRGAVEWILGELKNDPGFDFHCLVDSVAGMEMLGAAVRDAAMERPLKVLIEVGRRSGRCGVRSAGEAIALARAIRECPHLSLAGVETYEGIVQAEADAATKANDMLGVAMNVALEIDRLGLFDGDSVLLTAGGSGLFDLAALAMTSVVLSKPVVRIMRAGCYLVHDAGFYARLLEALKARSPKWTGFGFDLQPALEVWAHVLSAPEPGRVVCGLGKRDIGSDIEMPRLAAWARPGDRRPRPAFPDCFITGMFDQHVYLDGLGVSALRVGDLVGFTASHPCTTFDKWRTLLMVDDDYRVIKVARTYF